MMATSEQHKALYQSLLSLAISIGVVFAMLFIPAGTLDWPTGWAFIAIFVLLMIISILALWRVNPDIFVARQSVHAGTKGWDYVFIILIIGGFLAVPVVAGFDYRWSWAQAPVWVIWLGYVLFIASFAAQGWSQGVNRHFEPGVRIQSDRAHRVIDSGPYAFVRHPGYVTGSTLVIGMALALGSWAALIPAIAVIGALLLRTHVEDQTLQRELPGYADYALRVRSKWIPGLW